MKKIKHLKCSTCGKEYVCHNSWVDKHSKKLNPRKFKHINFEIKL
jgi:hypothetical protein